MSNFTKYNVLLINKQNKIYERTYFAEQANTAVDECLENYIKQILVFERNFKANEELWQIIKDNDDDLSIEHKIELINGLCRLPSLEIKRVHCGHKIEFDDSNATVNMVNHLSNNSKLRITYYNKIWKQVITAEVANNKDLEILVPKNTVLVAKTLTPSSTASDVVPTCTGGVSIRGKHTYLISASGSIKFNGAGGESQSYNLRRIK